MLFLLFSTHACIDRKKKKKKKKKRLTLDVESARKSGTGSQRCHSRFSWEVGGADHDDVVIGAGGGLACLGSGGAFRGGAFRSHSEHYKGSERIKGVARAFCFFEVVREISKPRRKMPRDFIWVRKKFYTRTALSF